MPPNSRTLTNKQQTGQVIVRVVSCIISSGMKTQGNISCIGSHSLAATVE